MDARRLSPNTDEVLRDLFKRKAVEVLERKIDGTTLFGNIRVRVRCHLCHSEEIRSSPQYWKSLVGLTGECFKCEGYCSAETAFLDRDRREICVVLPDYTVEELQYSLCQVAEYVTPPRTFLAETIATSNTNSTTITTPERNVETVVLRPARPLVMTFPRAIMSGLVNDVIPFLKLEKIDDVIERGMTALFFASYHGKCEVVKYLLEFKADVHAKSKDSMRPLHGGSSSKSVETVRILLDNGARVNDIDSNGFSPLHNCCMEGQLDISRLLIERGADVSVTTMTKATPLHLAARSGNRDLVAALLVAKAPVDAIDVFGRTPLANTIYFGKEPAGRVLLEGGASLLKVKSDLPIPMWAGGEAGRVIASKDVLIAQLQAQIENLKASTGTSPIPTTSSVTEQRVQELTNANDLANSRVIELERRIRESDIQRNLHEDRAAKARQLLQKAEADNTEYKSLVEKMQILLDQSRGLTLTARTELAQLGEINLSLKEELMRRDEDEIQKCKAEIKFTWTIAEEELGVSDFHRRRVEENKTKWTQARIELQSAEEKLKSDDVHVAMLSKLVEDRNEKRATLIALTGDTVQISRDELRMVETVLKVTTPFALEPVDKTRAAYSLRHENRAIAEREERAAFLCYQASLKQRELETKHKEEKEWAQRVVNESQEHKSMAALQDEALNLTANLIFLSRVYLRSKKELQHAQQMVSASFCDKDDLEVLDRCKTRFVVARDAYVDTAVRAKELISKGFIELEHCIKDLPESTVMSLDDFNIESKSDSIWKSERDGSMFALKCRPKHSAELEYHILKRLEHPCVISVEALFSESESMSVLVLPWITGGTLEQWLKTARPSVDTVRDVFRQILYGLSYIHSKGIIHGDIWMRNILMDDSQPRIIDFERSIDHTFVSVTETLKREEPINQATDIFALGKCLWEAFFPARVCYMRESDMHPEIPANEVPGLSHVLQWMLRRDPNKRPSTYELLQFPFFATRSLVSEQQPNATQSRLEAFRASVKLVKSFTDEYEEQNDPRDSINLTINKANMFREIAEALWATHSMLCVRFDVKFDGEEGIDGGALTTAMYSRFMKTACASNYFVVSRSGKVLPHPASDLSEEGLLIYRAVGVALARTLIDERTVDSPFASALFKFLQTDGLICEMGDLEECDYQLSQNMQLLLSPAGDCSLYNFEDVCEPAQDVTKHNKVSFVKKYINWTLVGCRMAALLAIREGFHTFGEEINRHLRILTWRDVKLLLCGVENLDSTTVLERLEFGGFGAGSKTPTFLREVIKGMNSQTLKRFLSFVTAQDSLPVVSTPKPIKIIRVAGDNNRLPTSHACFWQMDIPDYTDIASLKEKLMLAVGSDDAFTIN